MGFSCKFSLKPIHWKLGFLPWCLYHHGMVHTPFPASIPPDFLRWLTSFRGDGIPTHGTWSQEGWRLSGSDGMPFGHLSGFRKKVFFYVSDFFSSAHVLNVNIHQISYKYHIIPKWHRMAIVTAKGWCNSKMAIQKSDSFTSLEPESRGSRLGLEVRLLRAHGVFPPHWEHIRKKRHIKPFIEGVYVKIVKVFWGTSLNKSINLYGWDVNPNAYHGFKVYINM